MAAVRLLWPHSNLGDDPNEVVGMWAKMLAEVPHEAADAALVELAVGREHAPPVGVVVERAVDRALGLPSWDVVWPELDAKVRECMTVRGFRRPAVGEFSHPYVGEFARANWRQLCPSPREEDMGTHRAQMRDAYRAGAARQTRDAALEALGAPRPVGSLSGPRALASGG